MDRYYKILGLSSNATKDEIKKAYHEKMKALHPDKIHGTSLEDTATFFTTEINEAYEKIMLSFKNNESSTVQTDCIEKDIYIERLGNLKYSLSNNLKYILDAVITRSNNTFFISVEDIDWRINTGLSENVKNIMIEYSLTYSMTIYKENQSTIIIINKHEGDKWYIEGFEFNDNSSNIEKEITLIETGTRHLYTLSNDLNIIKEAIFNRTGHNVNLTNLIPKINPSLSVSVKKIMNEYDVEFSMTTEIESKIRWIWINRRVHNEWFTVILKENLSEKDKKLYIVEY